MSDPQHVDPVMIMKVAPIMFLYVVACLLAKEYLIPW